MVEKLFDWKTTLEGHQSAWRDVKSWVPQGSILGPLLFLFFINDIVKDIETDISLFADDTSLLETVSNPDLSSMNIQRDLVRIEHWAAKWKVSFNATKTKLLIISRKKNPFIYPALFLNDTAIQKVTEHTHLGLILHCQMNWQSHITAVCTKANKRLSLLKRASILFNLSRKDLEVLYFSMVRSVLEYGDIVFMNCTEGQKDELEQIQHEAAILISRAYRRTHYEDILEELGWIRLKRRRQIHALLLFHKMFYNIAPSYLSDLILPLKNRPCRYPRREQYMNHLLPPLARGEAAKNFFLPMGTRMWNNLNKEIRDITSFIGFKFKLKKLFLPEKNRLYTLAASRGAIHQARMRMGLSGLNFQRFQYDLIDYQFCHSCGANREDSYHFFFDCPSYAALRNTLLHQMENMLEKISIIVLDLTPDPSENFLRTFLVDLYLRGNKNLNFEENKQLFGMVQKYIVSTQRFQ